MPATSPRFEDDPEYFPISAQQELWCAGAGAGSFGPRFIVSTGLRISGHLDVAALQQALNDLVGRHEVLRTVIDRDSTPPRQRVHPPTPVPLEVREPGPDAGRSADERAVDLLLEAQAGSIDATGTPQLRATLQLFDDQDSALTLVSHHTTCDQWSLQLLVHDLAALYQLRTGARTEPLPEALPYREYTAWQRERTGDARNEVLGYWREKLAGARIFTLPTDRPIPPQHVSPYSSHHFRIDAATSARAASFAREARSSAFMVLLAAFCVLAHRITGTTDPVINTLVNGRTQRRFRNTAGSFIDFAALRTTIADCVTFRDIVDRTRRTCIDSYSNEVPIQLVEQALPELMAPLADPRNCDFIFGYFQSPFSEPVLPLAGGAQEIRGAATAGSVSQEMPGGAAWTLQTLPSGALSGCVQFNPDEFDPATITGWTTGYQELLTALLAEPDRFWKTF
ncbi:condensation domain-containing protein [Amycolatopsis sp. NPDC005003]